MNNILTFEDYRKMNIRQVESVIYHQFIDADIKDEVNEGIIRNAINKAASNFIQTALADEIEKGKELEKSIKEALEGLDKGFEELEHRINGNGEGNTESKSKLTAINKVKEAIKAVQSQAFDTLTMLGSEGEIDFAGFLGSSTVAAVANFGILFSPVRSMFITRKAYKYFIGIIKQTIRRNLLVIQLNFDQFENLILQKSFETEEDAEFTTRIETLTSVMKDMTEQLCGEKTKFLKGSKNKELKDKIEIIRKNTMDTYRQRKESSRSNPLSSLWSDQHNNTYTRTLEQIKQYINDDSQKELDALKNSIAKMSGNDPDLIPFGELMLCAAEEYAIHTNHGINNNFIKMSSVFNLENQKKLIELLKEAQEESLKEVEEKKNEQDLREAEERIEHEKEEGKEIYEKKLKGHEGEFDTFDKFEDTFKDDEKALRTYFQSDEGKDAYKELIEKNHLYKYLLFSDIELARTFFDTIDILDVVKVNNMNDLESNIVNKDQMIYYMMGERSINNALKSNTSSDYFGFDIGEKDIKNGYLINKDKDRVFKSIFDTEVKSTKVETDDSTKHISEKHSIPRYFLTCSSGANMLFDLFHNDFKTKIFTDTGEFENDISIENKKTIIKLINKHLHIGNDISTQLAEYLVRLEAHMLLKNKKPWYVVKNDKKMLKCFDPKSDNILNKNPFVEIRSKDYESLKKFFTSYHDLSKKDFVVDSETTTEKKEPKK